MTTFTIDSDNNIVARTGLPAGADASQTFTTAAELAKLAADWPMARLIETWNSFAGVAPFDDLKTVTKFTDRKSAVGRIWKAVTRLSPNGAEQATPVAPVKVASKNAPAKKAKPDTARKSAKVKRAKAATAKSAPKAKAPAKEGMSKKEDVLSMMRRAKGVTLAEIVEYTGWQKHTIRGFVSVLQSKGGLKVESSRTDMGDRCYRVK